MRRLHRLTPHVLALWNRVEDAVPTAVEIKDRHVQHQHRIVPTASALKPFSWLCHAGLFEVCRFHLCVSVHWQRRNTPRMPNKMPIRGLSSANQSEKSHSAML